MTEKDGLGWGCLFRGRCLSGTSSAFPTLRGLHLFLVALLCQNPSRPGLVTHAALLHLWGAPANRAVADFGFGSGSAVLPANPPPFTSKPPPILPARRPQPTPQACRKLKSLGAPHNPLPGEEWPLLATTSTDGFTVAASHCMKASSRPTVASSVKRRHATASSVSNRVGHHSETDSDSQ